MIPTRPARSPTWILKSHRQLFSFLALVLLGCFVSYVQATEQPTFSQCRVHIEAAIKAGVEEVVEPELESPVPSEDNPPEIIADPEVVPESEIPTEEPPVPETVEEPVVEEAEPEVAETEEAPQEEPVVEEPEVVEPEEPATETEEEHTEESASEAGEEEEGEQHDELDRDRRSVDSEHEEGAEDDEDEDHNDITDEDEENHDAEGDDSQEETEQEEGQEHEEHENEEESEEAPEEVSSQEEPAAAPAEETQPEPEPEPVVEEPAAEPEPVPEPVKATSSWKKKRSAPVEAPVPVVEPAQVQESVPQEEAAPAEPEAESVVVEEVTEDPTEGVIDEAPEVKRTRDHISEILQLNKDREGGMLHDNAVLVTLRDVKKIVETAVRPLETIFKYKDVSNRQFGDPEVFSKPLVLFLGPWSGGKSSIVNYLLGTEYTKNALKTGAEPSATFFQILMFGDSEESLSGTQLAADWTFSGLQKYGQAFIDRLRGKRLPNKLLEKVNIVEVPGILEVRKQVERPYPFNDVVQWFIDRADLIFVVYDPTKLDTGLEHEALFDQLKGRQNQVRVLLNKADSVTQEELLLIQNNLVWNLSPLMASPLPPTVYAGSFWSRPYKPDAPVRLLRAHEENMLNDIRDAIDNVVENTIAEARRHAVRVRNHAKMVDCYLTTYYNQKGFFGNKKKIADEIVDNPHLYHIFEGLSTLSNISRYDLPDSDVYRDFFRIHNLYDFKALSATCTFFRGCPLDKLDTAIAYELPELIGKYKKRIQAIPKKPAGATKS